jgi:histidinol dehydrogenase
MIKKIISPNKSNWEKLFKRPSIKQKEIQTIVDKVFKKVKSDGDKAIKKYTYLYDDVHLKSVLIKNGYIKNACKNIDNKLKDAIQLAKKNIENFHAAQKEKIAIINSTPGIKCWRESRAIDTVGIYIPGGTAPLFSTVLMLGIPAKLAGCKKIILCTPPNKDGVIDPVILYAAKLVGITSIFSIGGIQAIAAMTFGTETIPKVDKIFGPGNQYVTTAKQKAQMLGVAIDMPAGPSELLIIADKTCNTSFVAADLLSQAEHGADSQVILLSNSEKVINETVLELKQQLKNIPRKSIASKALKNSKAIQLKTINDCIIFSNEYAPEHLIIAINNPYQIVPKISNAGSVFIGNYSCESIGDYASGTNHTLPTNGYAKAHSGVSLDSFIKKITFQEIDKTGLQNIGPSIEIMAAAEQLFAHKNAVTIRLKNI